MTERMSRVMIAACVAIGVAYLAKAIYRAMAFTQGDFYFSMPGEYARRLNPTLWNSPDMQPALSYNNGRYFYGPTQYLTLYPVAFLPSYEAIAAVLLAVYPFVIAGGCYALWRMLLAQEMPPPSRPTTAVLAAAIFALVFAFLPLTQALIQREFEVVAWLALVLACLFLVEKREVAAGAAIAFVTWFKYWPVLLVGMLVLHRRFRAVAAFAATSVALLLAAHLVFGLNHFIIGKTVTIVGGLMRPLGSGEVLYPVIDRGAAKSDFCRQWVWGRGTQADVRWALCGVEDRMPAISAKAIFYVLMIATGALYAWGALMLERRAADTDTVKWGTIWEMSVLVIAGSAFVHAHFYYFIVFLLPLAALLYWYATRPQPWRRAKMALWAAAYLLLNVFMIPTSWLSALVERDAWASYLDSGLPLLGTILLLALVLLELVRLTSRAPRALATV